MALKNSVSAIPLKSIDSATFTGAYQIVNTGGTPNPCTILRIINNSNKDITVSYDGSTDNDFIPTLTQLTLNFQSNAQPNNLSSVFKQGTIIYVKGAAGAGLVYLAGYFNPSAG